MKNKIVYPNITITFTIDPNDVNLKVQATCDSMTREEIVMALKKLQDKIESGEFNTFDVKPGDDCGYYNEETFPLYETKEEEKTPTLSKLDYWITVENETERELIKFKASLLEPIDTSTSMHIHKEIYLIENETYAFLYEISVSEDDEPLITKLDKINMEEVKIEKPKKELVQKFQKKPVVVEAIQFNGNSNRQDIERFVGKELKSELESETAYVAGAGPPIFSLLIDTKEGVMRAMRGDWVIKEPFPTGDRDFYPCKNEIFKNTYNIIEHED